MSVQTTVQIGNPESPRVECERQLQFLRRGKSGTFMLYAFSDSGHGWVRVRKDVLAELDIAKVISGYSYMRKQFAYLEEDSDATKLIDALAKRGIGVKFRERISDNHSAIRAYEPYRSH
ncbi:MAG: hypothetical protein JRN62_03455 [Nitrososphaerota archaeon]|nr:hypothetical protein [Nitrososphaerota archaeon]MDG6948656.1 hypothetical protein [Nitrososphaerota archaeon]